MTRASLTLCVRNNIQFNLLHFYKQFFNIGLACIRFLYYETNMTNLLKSIEKKAFINYQSQHLKKERYSLINVVNHCIM